MKLNLGCGNNYLKGYINVDRVPGIADLVYDLDEFPYPWPDNSVDEILMRHVLEHLQDIRKVMDELWRILKPGGAAYHLCAALQPLSSPDTSRTSARVSLQFLPDVYASIGRTIYRSPLEHTKC